VVIMRTKLTPALLLIVLVAAAAYLYMRPVPQLTAENLTPPAPKTTPINLPWPSGGQAALGAQGYGLLASNNAATPVPVGSVAKVITALAVLQKKPIADNSQGPSITLDATDVGYFNYYYGNDGSVAKVSEGETLTEYEALEAMLLPSANNIADSLARWAFGSPQNYITYANAMLKSLGYTKTTVGDSNGFSDTTTSTADELVSIGLRSMQQPVIAKIVDQTSAQIPEAGVVNNVNWLLGTDGVVGIKTGNTDKAGGCYLFAAKHLIDNQTVTLVGAILGAPNLAAAISSARPILEASDSGFKEVSIIKKGQTVDTYKAPWGAMAQLKAAQDLSLLVWQGQTINIVNQPEPLSVPAASGSQGGSVSVKTSGQAASSPLYLSSSLASPPWYWRIFHK
jgi:D-alanyl-D-alanine carboxypeptidase (penicillin-binding protein 5/6)